ncbi:MAG TPA: CHAT domain-containing tetratricopeptide repeat protein [Bryobacteraceae bacterium]|jgi:CHAT domain-containing protein/tetratricopeptide (TPR) repeat protein|nr:CHAT domain-containing tetratricopeptide repeat protein [Bryobacteraceae bacterium]
MAALVLALLFALAALAQDAGSWTALDAQAEAAYNKGDLAGAVRVGKLAVAAATGEKESAHSLDRLGFFQFSSGDLKSGEASLRQALDIRKTKIGADTLDYAESANDLALFCRDANQFPEGQNLAQQSVEIRRRMLGSKDPRVAESLNTLGGIEALAGEYDDAIAHLEEALAIHKAQTPPEFSEEFGTLCVNLAGTYQRVGRYAKSEELFEEGLAVLRVKPGIDHPAYSASLVGYAYLQADLGHYSEAEKLYDEAGKLLREQLGEQHPAYAAYLNNRAALYAAVGNVTLAEADYRKSLELKRKLYGPDAVTIGASLRNLASLVYARNREEGGKLFQEDVDLYARNAKAPAFDYTTALLGLAAAQRDRGDLAAARATLQHASDVMSKGLGMKHPLYAAVLRDLGAVHQAAHEYPAAEKDLRDAIAIVEEVQGANHPDLAQYLERLGAVYEEAGDYASAEPLYRRSLDISDRTLADMLTIGSERSKAAVLAHLDDPIPRLIAFQAKARTVEARELAFEAVARRKGRILDAVHDWGHALRQNADPEVRRGLQQREALMECETSLTVALGYRDLKPPVVGACTLAGTGLEGKYERLLHDLRSAWTEARGKQALDAVTVLRQRIDALEAGLSRAIPQLASTLRPARIEDIRAHLQADEQLVEFVEYRNRYGAFVVSRSVLQWTDLGPATPIDLAVRDLFGAANDWSVARTRGEQRNAQAAAQTARDAMATLSAKLAPALPLAVSVHRLRIAPDGMLNLVPFAALSGAHGGFLIEKAAIDFLSASRDLAAAVPAHASGGEVVIAVSPGPGAGPASAAAGRAFRADGLERLAGASAEARDVQRWFPRAELLGEGEASEQRIKQLHRPALLHIVGHGVVRGDEDCRATPDSPGCRLAALDPAARVMNLSAIVLEEAYGRAAGSQEDGMLTALELQSLDLDGTEMVVLSQCRMADGIPSSGEGVFGMRRAAAIAGVKAFVAPLWKVDDAAQRKLMDAFYRELSAGKGRAEALRQAQLQISKAAGSFLEWAPVILSGDPDPLPRSLFAR